MPHQDTQTNARTHRPGVLDETIIDLRRRRQRRGRAVLAEGCVIAFVPHGRFAVRIRAGNETTLADEITLDVDAAATATALPASFEACAALVVPWQTIGWISHRRIMPTFDWDMGVIPWFEDADAVAAKGFAAYYHVHKGYELNPGDGILANPVPVWTTPELEAT